MKKKVKPKTPPIFLVKVIMGFVDFLESLLRKILPPQAVLLNHTFKDIAANRCVYFAAEIGIANILEEGPKPIEQLAEESGMNADALYRVMRTLSTLGIFKEKENRYFETNKPGKFLRHNAADSMSSFIRVFGQPWLFVAWNDFERTVKNGKDYYENNYGENLFKQEFLPGTKSAISGILACPLFCLTFTCPFFHFFNSIPTQLRCHRLRFA